MDQTTDTTPAQDLPDTPAAASAEPAPAAPADADLVGTSSAAVHRGRARALELLDELQQIKAAATQTPNVGELVARLAGLMHGVLAETVDELDRMGA